jgi:hypothetical protein
MELNDVKYQKALEEHTEQPLQEVETLRGNNIERIEDKEVMEDGRN